MLSVYPLSKCKISRLRKKKYQRLLHHMTIKMIIIVFLPLRFDYQISLNCKSVPFSFTCPMPLWYWPHRPTNYAALQFSGNKIPKVPAIQNTNTSTYMKRVPTQFRLFWKSWKEAGIREVQYIRKLLFSCEWNFVHFRYSSFLFFIILFFFRNEAGLLKDRLSAWFFSRRHFQAARCLFSLSIS